MAAFDREEAARQGRGETIPTGWTKFAPSSRALWLNLISYGLCALLLFGLIPFLLITGNTGQAVSPLEAAASFGLGLIFLFILLRLIPPLLNKAGHFFLVTTDGFVLVAGRKVIGMPLAEISAASREPGLLGAKLVIQQRTGKALALPIGRVYGTRALREMEETLAAAIKASGQEKRKKTKR
ncbi:MAG TPA: hypothetical protein VFU32_11100 [Ktedonobacterales bacterium]|nr:hypothetical protein [Ktedonobacterales bacterium]